MLIIIILSAGWGSELPLPVGRLVLVARAPLRRQYVVLRRIQGMWLCLHRVHWRKSFLVLHIFIHCRTRPASFMDRHVFENNNIITILSIHIYCSFFWNYVDNISIFITLPSYLINWYSSGPHCVHCFYITDRLSKNLEVIFFSHNVSYCCTCFIHFMILQSEYQLIVIMLVLLKNRGWIRRDCTCLVVRCHSVITSQGWHHLWSMKGMNQFFSRILALLTEVGIVRIQSG